MRIREVDVIRLQATQAALERLQQVVPRGPRDQPSLRCPSVGEAQATDQNRQHLDGDLRTTL